MGFTVYVLFSSSMEFICAQSPYSMKGLLIGVLYIFYGLSISLSVGLSKLLQKAITKVGDTCHIIIWFHAVLIGFAAVMICIQVVVVKFYAYRKRDETLK